MSKDFVIITINKDFLWQTDIHTLIHIQYKVNVKFENKTNINLKLFYSQHMLIKICYTNTHSYTKFQKDFYLHLGFEILNRFQLLKERTYK